MKMDLYFILFSLLPCLVSAATQQNTFIIPQAHGDANDYIGNLAWPLDSTQTIQWFSNFSTYQLYMYQNNLVSNGDPVLLTTGSNSDSGQQETTFTWNVATTLNFVTVPVFWFILYEGTDHNASSFNSHYFNITSPTSSTSSSSSSSTPLSTSSISTSITSSTTTSSPTPSPTSTSISTSQSGISTGAKIGIGIGIPVFVIAASITGFLFWQRSRHSKTTVLATSAPQFQPVSTASHSNGAHSLYALGYAKPELPANETRPYELEGQRDLPMNEMPS